MYIIKTLFEMPVTR